MKVVCTKDLYKSTYKGLAFKKGKKYEVVSEEDDFIYLRDEAGHDFNFVRNASNIYYVFSDYFIR